MKTLYWILGGVAVAALAVRGRALKSGSFLFPYRDAAYLGSGQKLGGMAYVPPGTPNGSRLLVYLHGNNDGGMMHGGMGASDTSYDLRKVVPPGTVVAAPSQTRYASGAGLWAGFNLDEFVAEVEKVIGGSIDRSNVILMGHSGGGCAPGAGILSPIREIRPRLVAAVDVCAGSNFGEAFGKLGEEVPVRVFYQTRSWPRDFKGFEAALKGRASLEKIEIPPTEGNPHSAIVPIVARQLLS